MGAASAGDREARDSLDKVYPSLVMEHGWDLELLRSGIVKGVRNDIDNGFRRLNGDVAKIAGETCTKAIIRALRSSQLSHGARAVVASAMLLPDDKLLKIVLEVADALKEAQKAGELKANADRPASV